LFIQGHPKTLNTLLHAKTAHMKSISTSLEAIKPRNMLPGE